MFEISNEIKVVCILLVLLFGLYIMKDILFPPKQVSFDPVVTEKTVDEDKNEMDENFIPSKTFTGRKPGYVFKRGDLGQGYYRDNV
jgi:hypothetical protein